MTDLHDARRAEARAERQYNRALTSIGDKLTEEGVRGTEQLHRTLEATESFRSEYETKRFERMAEERDGKMIHRGTKRGVFVAVGIICVFWSGSRLIDAFTIETGGLVSVTTGGRVGREPEVVGQEWIGRDEYRRHLLPGGIVVAIISGVSFYMFWRLGQIPDLGDEDK